jgi:hypothetical protein
VEWAYVVEPSNFALPSPNDRDRALERLEKRDETIEVTFPVRDVLRKIREAGPIGSETYIATSYCNPMTKDLGNLFKEKCVAGRTGCALRVSRSSDREPQETRPRWRRQPRTNERPHGPSNEVYSLTDVLGVKSEQKLNPIRWRSEGWWARQGSNL